jgi:ferredoxin--NADP+ reductase
LLREAVMHLYKPTGPGVATITKSEICTASKKAAGFVRHIEFDVSGTDLVGRCIPGQSIGVIPPGVDANGKPHKLRLYSLASSSAGEDGKGTILDLQPGDKIQVTGPAGKKFVLPVSAQDHDYVFFATGTGIAPFRGMIIDLLRENANAKIALIMGSPYSSDLLYDGFFRDLAEKHTNFRYLPAISREPNGAHGKLYVQDRLRTDSEVLMPMLAGPRTLVYICGIAGMELGILAQIASQLSGAEREQYLRTDAEAADVKTWERSMLHKSIHLTRRISMEVYS